MKDLLMFNQTVQNAFDSEPAKFEAFHQLMLDYANDNLSAGVDKKDANAKIVSKLRAIIGCDEHSTKAEIRKAIRRNKTVIFDIIEDTVQDLLVTGWARDPFFQKYVEVRNIALGDRNEFYVPDDSLFSVMKVSGNHHDIIRQRLGAGSLFPIVTSWVAIKFYSEYERLITNLEDFGTFVRKLYESYDQYVRQAMYDALEGYAASVPAAMRKTGSITAANLRELCYNVSALTGSPVVIMGTRPVLQSVIALTDSNWISAEMKEDHYKTGLIGYFEGYDVVEIPQGFKGGNTTSPLVSNDYLWIMPVSDQKFIKVVNEGDTQMYQVPDPQTNMDMTFEAELQTKLGVGIVFATSFGVYDIAGS